METCLVTGASGFIGKYIVQFLDENGFNVVGLSRQKKPPDTIANAVGDWISIDLAKPDGIKEILRQSKGIKYLIHLAALVRDNKNLFDAKNLYQQEIISPLQLVDALITQLKHICLFSSTSVYGNCEKVIDESYPIKPTGLYDTNKMVLEDSLSLLARKRDVFLSIFRISSVYGPGMPEKNAIPQFINSFKKGNSPIISGDPNAKRDYIFVKDLPDVTLKAMKSQASGIYNIASGSPQCLLDIVEILNKLLGVSLEPRILSFEPQTDKLISIEKACSSLGFFPTSLEHGLRQMV
jgi:nucleoside-diphosphate-sugar epimerase